MLTTKITHLESRQFLDTFNALKTKVLMLSATPVNNRFTDLRHQLELAYEGNPNLINDKLGTKHTKVNEPQTLC